MAHLARRYTQDVADIDDEICSHALIDRSNGSWQSAHSVRQVLTAYIVML
jgi:hypothetical protein